MICLRQRCRAKKAFWSSHLIGQIQTNSDIWLVRRILYLTVLNGFIPDSYVFLFYSRAFTCDILFSFWKASRRSTAGWLLIKKRNLKLFPWERNEKEVDKKYMRQLICWGRKCLLPQRWTLEILLLTKSKQLFEDLIRARGRADLINLIICTTLDFNARRLVHLYTDSKW